MSITIHRAGQKHLYLPGGSLGVRACSAGEIGGAAGVTSTRSVSFDGVDDYNAVTAAALNVTGAISVSAWIKGGTTTGAYTGIVSRMNDGAPYNGYSLVIYNSSPSMVPGFHVGGVYFNGAVGSGNMNNSQWYHLVGTFDGTTAKIYVDGAEAGSTGATNNLDGGASEQFDIGRDYAGNVGRYFSGLIDDVRIYNTALSPTDVANLYAGLDVTAGLIAYWPLEEGSGITTADTIGGNTGTLTNGPTWSTDVPAPLA